MATSSKDITFVVPGRLQDAGAVAASGAARGRASASVLVGAPRGNGENVRLTARPGEDVVVLAVANGPTLVLHPESARDLLLAQSPGATRGDADAAGAIPVSARLGWPGLEQAATRGATRGWMGEAVLGAFEVITGVTKDAAADLATAAITRKLDGAVDAGVYQLTADPLPASLKKGGFRPANIPAAPAGPMLVLIHGTFVDTVSTFGKLWTTHPRIVRDLFGFYRGHVYALDHPTLAESPIANALTLVEAMPAGARLHLATHSRGGLVAEILARACGGGTPSAQELALFEGSRYARHRDQLRELVKAARSKQLKVERMVRVACPAHGTLLASTRLDAYLSVLRWGLDLANVPVAPELVDFLHEIARRRADPTQLPGLEAMMPESAVVKWLNSRRDPVPGELRVVAGDMEGDSVGSWVKTLLSDAFYWTDNDLVVQTRSMYGGMARAPLAAGAGASFVLDRGAKVTHFNYFANPRTADAIAAALMHDAPEDFSAIGPLSWSGEDASGTRAARAVARSRGPAGNAAERPAVFVLPGILGSNLKLDGKRIWLGTGFINALLELRWSPATAARIEPDGPVGDTYDALMERLADTHEVIPFAYDWRRPIEDEARRLAAAVDAALAARDASGQPVRLLAHSMGGLVARAMQLEKPATWKRLMAREGARLLMLGTPNGGSWSPMQTLSGDDTFGNTLVALGSLFDNRKAREMMAALPGFIQLQAGLLDPQLNLKDRGAWQKLVDDDLAALAKLNLWHEPDTQKAVYAWSAPPQAVLDQAVALRLRLDAQLPALAADAGKMALVVGDAPFTPAGYVTGAEGLEYLNAPHGGDGRVTIDNALLPGVATWKVDAVHGKLPAVQAAFDAYVELLQTGVTGKLQRWQAGTRGADRAGPPAVLVRSRPSRGLEAWLPPSGPGDVMSPGREEPGRPKTAALAVSVRNGDLRFIGQALLIGHYRSMLLTGAEAAIDRLIDGAMGRALKAGLYPDAPGSHQIFRNKRVDPENPNQMARPAAALVAGLGEEGKLREVDLAYTVRQAVLAYAQRLSESSSAAASQFDLAATLIGSGGTGITPGAAARAIAQGVLEANIKLHDNGWPRVGHLLLIEQYLDRAGEAWHALQLQERSAPSRLKLVGKIEFGPGALRRPLDSGYRGARHDFISALRVPGRDPAQACISYTLDTRRARTEVRAQHAQGTLLRQLVTKASNDANTDPLIGRTLFNLLVPQEIEPFLAGTGELVLEVDPDTASIPWEMLDTNPDEQMADARPWAIRSKLVRKLRIENFRAKPRDATVDDSVLVIGEPLTPARFPRLEGARREAIAVAAQLAKPGRGISSERVHALVEQADAQTVINALFERAYRIVHIAGHGEAGPQGGVVLSGEGVYLGSNEVEAMRVVPELVFLNCCHLAGREATIALPSYDRAQFAANTAEALIRVGVRCVVAAGWAVEDDPAAEFASRFYESLLAGGRFIDAVGAGRAAALRANPRGNTWAAYQCYGDPDWMWRREGVDPQWPTQPLADELAGVASPVSLTLALETLAIQSALGGKSPGHQLDRLRYLESEFAPLWGGMGAVAEAFGVAYAAAQAKEQAIAWYRVALEAQDGSASMRTAARLAELLARRK